MRTPPENRAVCRRVASYWLTGLGLVVAYGLVRPLDWQGSVELHTLMEALATVLALFVGILALVRHYSTPDKVLLLVGTGFLGTAFLDGYHTVVTSTFFAPRSSSGPPSLVPWSWSASRWFLSLSLLLSWLAWRKDWRVTETRVYVATGVLTLASFLFFALVPLPRTYHPELFLHRPEELLPAVFFGLALMGYLRKGVWRHDLFEHWLVLALIIGVIGQSVLMSSSAALFDLEFDLAYLLKTASYVCVLTGLLYSISAAVRQEVKSKELLADANLKLVDVVLQERDRAHAALARRAEALEHSNRDLENFAYVASHDLQEPLRKVRAFGERLERKHAEALNEEGRDYLARMVRAADRMQTLIGDLLTYSRVNSQACAFAPVDLRQCAIDAVNDLQVLVEECGATVDINGLPAIEADGTQMRQLFQNLIGNAIKYRAPGRLPRIDVGAEAARAGMCRIRVRDNGIGFEDQYRDLIFGMFQRLHGRGKYSGTGVGLAVCRRIAERHGGTLTATGQPAEGAVFTITLPVDQSNRGSQP